MPLVDISGAYDLHVHSNPSLFERAGSDLYMAMHAAEDGLGGILLKNHFESTVGRAFHVDMAVEGTSVFGGLVLNHFTGGINPVAVEHSIRLGAKQIWMPTIDSKAHIDVFGSPGGYEYQQSGNKVNRGGISILTDKGKLTEDAKSILLLAKESEIILGTAHLAREEIFALAEFAGKEGFKKLLVTHPYFNPPRLSIPDQVQLVAMGAIIELCGGNLYPIPGVANLSNYLESIENIDTNSLILSSDAGQPRKSLPAEVLRVFAQCLMDKGITQKQINTMTKKNPAKLLGL